MRDLDLSLAASHDRLRRDAQKNLVVAILSSSMYLLFAIRGRHSGFPHDQYIQMPSPIRPDAYADSCRLILIACKISIIIILIHTTSKIEHENNFIGNNKFIKRKRQVNKTKIKIKKTSTAPTRKEMV